jgi:hypothetical protein
VNYKGRQDNINQESVTKDKEDCDVSIGMGKSYFGVSTEKQTPWPLVRKQTVPTEQPPLVGEI